MRPFHGLFLLAWALPTSLAGFLQPSPASFTVGVLRRDALIVPFATYDGKHWNNHWPVPKDDADVPLSLPSVPGSWWGSAGRHEAWQISMSDGSSQTVKVRQPDWALSYCQKQVGLRTDYQPRLWPPRPGTDPYPKDGLAVSPPRPVERIDVLLSDAPERDDVVEAIHRKVGEQEAAALERLATQHIHAPRQFPEPPGQKDLLSMRPMSIEALYAYGSARRTYFVEAAREYSKAGECTLMAFARARVIRESGKFVVENAQVSLHACDRNDIVYMWPLGVMTVPTGVYWIAQVSGWSYETYNIFDITPHPRPENLVTAGGGC